MKEKRVLSVFGQIDEKFIAEAAPGKTMNKRRGWRSMTIIAACVCLLVSLSIVAYATNLFGLRDLLLPMGQTDQTNNEHMQIFPEHPRLSLSGYMNTPESQALSEWRAFLNQYDKDHTIPNSGSDHLDESIQRYVCYSVYTKEMADELERIASKYGLKLHTQIFDLVAHPELLTPCEGYLGENQGFATYMYEDGSFHVDGIASAPNFGTVDFQLQRSVRGTFHDITLSLVNITDYQEWEYETIHKVPVVLALGPSRALVLADLDDSFVIISFLTGTNNGLTGTTLENLADSFDLSKLDPVVVPDLADIANTSIPTGVPASENTTARKTYAAVLRDLLNNGILPDGTLAECSEQNMSINQFAVLDVTGNKREELVLLYTTTETDEQRGMVVSFEETYTGVSRPVSIRIDEAPMLTFYDNGYIVATASDNQTWGELQPYTLYRSIADAYDSITVVADVSGSGTLYQVSFYYGADDMFEGVYFWDVTEYEAWLADTLGNAQERTIPYLSLTEENIAWMESQ